MWMMVVGCLHSGNNRVSRYTLFKSLAHTREKTDQIRLGFKKLELPKSRLCRTKSEGFFPSLMIFRYIVHKTFIVSSFLILST